MTIPAQMSPSSTTALFPGEVDHLAIDALVAWMIDGAPPSGDANRIIDAICQRVVAAGVPVDRFALFMNTLHPNIAARRFRWTRDGGVVVNEVEFDIFSQQEYWKNPLPRVTSEGVSIRRRLTDPQALSEYMILGELEAEGFTDYLAQPLVFTTGEIHAATWSTKDAHGFSLEQIDALDVIRRPLARLTEAYLLRLNAASILSTYVGRGGGEQILQGRVHRGDGEEIDAAILFTDLMDFTRLSNTLSGPEMVAILNDAFDIMVPPVEANGGEVLKFLGDGFFAIFPYGGERTMGDAVQAASRTIMEGEARLAETELGRTVSFRSALHAGRFHYGNIGGANRLDFTAIGRPINYAARLLTCASDLSLHRVASAEVAAHLCCAPRVASEVPFKGFEGLQKIYVY
ncbi:adenylate/guanylate cyclase domain-containing protein [Aquibium carbonis]|uniref:Adenylate/guanylate cyclase domain-containing protein n=1 Tax=Aquibium carbonis TaxID=2495581 RepID=A0A429YUG7_9HYPH|nr:adenylate/guanylate cyclase domain-containing protein [Aquibium carbonis]RST85113.1 adenylate/guanylate cyclase domain-containing protein [Aquibium carbonis]